MSAFHTAPRLWAGFVQDVRPCITAHNTLLCPDFGECLLKCSFFASLLLRSLKRKKYYIFFFFLSPTTRLQAWSAMSKSSPWLISQPFKTKADSSQPAPEGTANRKRKLGSRRLRQCVWGTHPTEPQTEPQKQPGLLWHTIPSMATPGSLK